MSRAKDAKFTPMSEQYVDQPHGLFENMRQIAPVYYVEKPRHVAGWYIFRYDDCRTLLKDSGQYITKINPSTEHHKRHRKLDIVDIVSRHVLFSDSTKHSQQRQVMEPMFTSATQAAWESNIQTAIAEILATLKPGSSIDLVQDYAEQLPAKIIGYFLESTSDEALRQWANAMVGLIDLTTPIEHVNANLMGMVAFLIRSLDGPATTERSFFQLFREAESNRTLSRIESVGNLAFLISAGYETAANAIANGVLALVRQGHWQVAGNTSRASAIADECLRFDGPLKAATPRWAAQNFNLDGRQIKKGERIFLMLASANRDETVYERANQFILGRREQRHLAFGSSIHHCLGAQVARTEIGLALTGLAQAFPNLTIDTKHLAWRKNLMIRGPRRLNAHLNI